MKQTLKQLRKDRKVLIRYLKMKLRQTDWHGVRDCCVDIEIVENQIINLIGRNNEKTN